MTRSPRRSRRPSAPSPDAHAPGRGRPRTVFVGTGDFGVPSLRLLAGSEVVDLVGLVTAPPRPSGRGHRLTASPVEDAARELGLAPILRPSRLRAPEAVAEVLALAPALIVLADYGQIVPPALLDLPLGALNLHPSLLPRHRGATPVPATILAGDQRSGVTLMRMDAGLDTGPVVAVREIDIAGTETAPDLEARLAAEAAALLEETLPRWIRGEVEARPQSADGVTLTRPLAREDGRLDAGRSASELERRVRAYQPWPGSWLDTGAGRITVWRARIVPDGSGGVPGALVREGGGLGLATTNGVLELVEVQPAGGRRMSGADLVRGRPHVLVG